MGCHMTFQGASRQGVHLWPRNRCSGPGRGWLALLDNVPGLGQRPTSAFAEILDRADLGIGVGPLAEAREGKLAVGVVVDAGGEVMDTHQVDTQGLVEGLTQGIEGVFCVDLDGDLDGLFHGLVILYRMGGVG